ncbi:hypothetical protein IPL68_06020 [Candidatus Saccharibacteria bacterium]|nr:MAG: hypothetical protein IPL68_06020 [Candidatus Saccharibacteria bacterium]
MIVKKIRAVSVNGTSNTFAQPRLINANTAELFSGQSRPDGKVFVSVTLEDGAISTAERNCNTNKAVVNDQLSCSKSIKASVFTGQQAAPYNLSATVNGLPAQSMYYNPSTGMQMSGLSHQITSQNAGLAELSVSGDIYTDRWVRYFVDGRQVAQMKCSKTVPPASYTIAIENGFQTVKKGEMSEIITASSSNGPLVNWTVTSKSQNHEIDILDTSSLSGVSSVTFRVRINDSAKRNSAYSFAVQASPVDGSSQPAFASGSVFVPLDLHIRESVEQAAIFGKDSTLIVTTQLVNLNNEVSNEAASWTARFVDVPTVGNISVAFTSSNENVSAAILQVMCDEFVPVGSYNIEVVATLHDGTVLSRMVEIQVILDPTIPPVEE